MFDDDQSKHMDESFKSKQFDATGGTSGMDMSHMMQNIENEDKEFIENKYDDEEEEDDTNVNLTGIDDNYPGETPVKSMGDSTATKQIQEEYKQLEKEIREMQ